jgi:tRNA-specific 2-thiouridylase
MKKTKVLMAMSGGVDSSVAALLMKNKGYEVVGAFMKNWSDTKDPLSGECTWREDRRVALKIAARLGIPLITLDFEKEYRKQVVDEMFKKYRKGITPNPDIDCNQKVKFPLLWKAAKKLGADYVITGHYSRIAKDKKGNYELLRAKGEGKDQSYFLYRLSQKDLSHSLFPIGDFAKKEVRKIAEKAGFTNFNRKSTVGICFIGKVNLKKFLQRKIKPKPGRILDPEGKQIGEHDGIYYYTIGQRIGPRFGIDLNRLSQVRSTSSINSQSKGKDKIMKKWYVARKIPPTNTIIAAPEGHELNFRKEITIKEPHWINEIPKKEMRVSSRIRQVGELLPSILKYSNGKYKVILKKQITGVSEGQAIVLYKGKKVLGGGVISF